MEKLAAGFENRKWFALPIHSKRKVKKAESGKQLFIMKVH
jgi:hypothetical protein